MDFLDPKAKRNHIVRLIIGYGLMAVLIGIATLILVLQAYGFDVDRKSGQVIQNGLVYVDSAPDAATVKFNEKEQTNKTNNRFALPSGDYQLSISKGDYRAWNTSFKLDGGEVERFTYPLLIPNKLETVELRQYDAAPTFTTESLDRRWVVMNKADSLTNFVEYDLNSLTDDQPKEREFNLPNNLFTAAAGAHSLELVEWSTDNKHFLVKHAFAGGHEFVVVDREEPNTSFSINRLLGQNPTKIVLRDKKFDQWYLYFEAGGALQTADAKKAVAPLLTGVTAFKTHDAETILYSQLAADGKTQRVTLRQGKESHLLREAVSSLMYLDIARYDDAWYVAVGADSEQRTYIYKDPFEVLQKKDKTKPTPVAVLRNASNPLSQVSFSQNTRFIVAQSGQHFELYDAEYEQTFRYDIAEAFDPGAKVVWMDGHRLLARSQGKALIFDFDGNNRQILLPSLAAVPVMFDRDYVVLYTLDASKAAAGKTGLYGTQLRTEEDR
jgi:hypothetical protein